MNLKNYQVIPRLCMCDTDLKALIIKLTWEPILTEGKQNLHSVNLIRLTAC